MKSNLKAICHLSQDWKSEHEGLLRIKDKKNQFSEHWARLKGNLLILLKTPDKNYMEVFGIIIMEYFKVENHVEIGFPYSFKITFESGDSPLIMNCKTQTEMCNWQDKLNSAKFKGFTRQLQSLNKEVANSLNQLNSRDTSNLNNIRDNNTNELSSVCEGVSKQDQSGLHISISCQNLPNYSYESKPNPSVTVYIYDSLKDISKYHSETEIIPESNDPNYNNAVFISEQYYDPKYYIKFVIHDNRDFEVQLKHKIGSADFCISTLLNNSNLLSPLENNSKTTMSGVMRLLIQEQKSQQSLMELSSEIRIFHNMVDNKCSRSYSFPKSGTANSSNNLNVIEMTGDSEFGISVTLEYLKKLLEDESLVQESLRKFATSDPMVKNLSTYFNIAIRARRTNYESIFSAMSYKSAEGIKFHPSSERNSNDSLFMPINLQIHRMSVNTESDRDKPSFLDVITMGACAAHCLKFKFPQPPSISHSSNQPSASASSTSQSSGTPPTVNGGLITMSRLIPNFSKSSLLTQSDELLKKLVRMDQDIRNQLRHLCSFIAHPTDVRNDAEMLKKKIEKYLKYFENPFFIALSLENIRRDHQTINFKIEELLGENKPISKEVKACCDKLEESMDHTNFLSMNILWSKIFEILKSDEYLSNWSNFCFREHAVYCQLLTGVLSGIMLVMGSWTNQNIWSQMIQCGVPLYFEGLLSSYNFEIGILEDWRWVIDKLKDLKLFVSYSHDETGNSEKKDKPKFQFINIDTIELTCPESTWKFVPVEVKVKRRVRLHLHPYLFNVGINENQTFSDKISKNNLIQQINLAGYKSIKSYYDLHVRNIGNPNQTWKNAEIIDRLNDLKYEIDQNKNKPVVILKMAQEISHSWNAVRFTSCKSAKDRTSMAITLEQVRWLKNVHGLPKSQCKKALDCLRSTGLRRNNCFKNIGYDKYAFNMLQVNFLPKKYKPPVGSYGGGET